MTGGMEAAGRPSHRTCTSQQCPAHEAKPPDTSLQARKRPSPKLARRVAATRSKTQEESGEKLREFRSEAGAAKCISG